MCHDWEFSIKELYFVYYVVVRVILAGKMIVIFRLLLIPRWYFCWEATDKNENCSMYGHTHMLYTIFRQDHIFIFNFLFQNKAYEEQCINEQRMTNCQHLSLTCLVFFAPYLIFIGCYNVVLIGMFSNITSSKFHWHATRTLIRGT